MPPGTGKTTEIVRIEYNCLGEREKVVIAEPSPSTRCRPRSSQSVVQEPPRLSSAAITETTARLEHTINVLRELLLGKIARDDAGIPPSMAGVAKEYFRVAFGATDVGKEKMAALMEAITELQVHSSFLRMMGQALIASKEMGRLAVFFSVWSLLVEQARVNEEELMLEISPNAFILIFQEACDRYLSIPPNLHEFVERRILERASEIENGASVSVDDLQELLADALESNDMCCLEVEKLQFSKAALPHNILLPTSSTSSRSLPDKETTNMTMLASLRNLRLLLDEFILHDCERSGILPLDTAINVILMWQMAILSPGLSEDKDVDDASNAGLIAECFSVEKDDGDESSMDYIELIAFVHERILEALAISSIENILHALSTYERGLDQKTYQHLNNYVDTAILDRRKWLGRNLQDRLTAASAKASRVPKSYHETTACRQTKTPIYLTEQLLYTEEQTTVK